MPKKRNVQDAHMSGQLKALHGAVLSIVRVMNQPQRDEAMVRAAGISLDRALFPLLVGIERFGPVKVGDLADGVGRNYTTVSRQVTKLEELGLVQTQEGAQDRRAREAVVTARGKALTDSIDAARERIGRSIFEKWDERDFAELVRLLQKFAADIREQSPPQG